jgi:MoaA/NifB/PqqE/SkfB family radical SAM enzyme
MNLKDRLDTWKAEVGAHTRGTVLMIDTVAGCSFACPSCAVSQYPTRKGMMSFDFYRKMLDRIESQIRIKYVLLYSFSEPFLHPELPRFIEELKMRGVRRVMVSTNLSRPKNLQDAMAAGLDELRISFSGFDIGTYFHTGRNMAQFREACKQLKTMPRWGCKVSLIFHIYKTNRHELPAVQKFADEHKFELIKETAFIIPFEKFIHDTWTEKDRELIGHLIMTPAEKLAQKSRSQFCYYQSSQIVIDAKGKVFLCRHVFDDAFIVGDIMQDSIWEIRKRMKNHSFCVDCKFAGLNLYTQPDTIPLGQQ